MKVTDVQLWLCTLQWKPTLCDLDRSSNFQGQIFWANSVSRFIISVSTFWGSKRQPYKNNMVRGHLHTWLFADFCYNSSCNGVIYFDWYTDLPNSHLPANSIIMMLIHAHTQKNWGSKQGEEGWEELSGCCKIVEPHDGRMSLFGRETWAMLCRAPCSLFGGKLATSVSSCCLYR